MNILRTASLGFNFTGFYKKRVYDDNLRVPDMNYSGLITYQI